MELMRCVVNVLVESAVSVATTRTLLNLMHDLSSNHISITRINLKRK
jgi:hypothetical protein